MSLLHDNNDDSNDNDDDSYDNDDDNDLIHQPGGAGMHPAGWKTPSLFFFLTMMMIVMTMMMIVMTMMMIMI